MSQPTTVPLTNLPENLFEIDTRFDKLYPLHIRRLGHRHWTNLSVAESAANFLAAEKGAKILDIGSGVGKFCLAAAYYKPDALYYGIEQRKELVDYAEAVKALLQLNNVSFIHGNLTDLDLKQYDHFYFYNSFFENIVDESKIDESIVYSTELFNHYNWHLYKQLQQKPSGTRLATYHSTENEIPEDYLVVGSDMEGVLKFWMKE